MAKGAAKYTKLTIPNMPPLPKLPLPNKQQCMRAKSCSTGSCGCLPTSIYELKVFF